MFFEGTRDISGVTKVYLKDRVCPHGPCSIQKNIFKGVTILSLVDVMIEELQELRELSCGTPN